MSLKLKDISDQNTNKRIEVCIDCGAVLFVNNFLISKRDAIALSKWINKNLIKTKKQTKNDLR